MSGVFLCQHLFTDVAARIWLERLNVAPSHITMGKKVFLILAAITQNLLLVPCTPYGCCNALQAITLWLLFEARSTSHARQGQCKNGLILLISHLIPSHVPVHATQTFLSHRFTDHLQTNHKLQIRFLLFLLLPVTLPLQMLPLHLLPLLLPRHSDRLIPHRRRLRDVPSCLL